MISIGLPWMLVQSVAWLGMAVTYTAESGSWIQGLSDTFDGNHPCPLCKAVQKNFEQDKQASETAPTSEKTQVGKFVFGIVKVPVFLFPPRHQGQWSTISDHPRRLTYELVTPPPKAAA